MDGDDFFTAIALLLIFEGLMPFASPKKWQKLLLSISELESSSIRVFGLISMSVGLLLLYWLN